MADGIDPIRSMPSLRGAPALFIQNFNYHCPNGGVRVPTAMAVIHQSFAFLNPATGFTPYHLPASITAATGTAASAAREATSATRAGGCLAFRGLYGLLCHLNGMFNTL